MHIAFVNTLYAPLPNTGGAEATLRFLARRLADRGHRCTIITLTPEKQESTGDVDGLTVHYLPLANVYWPHGEHRPKWLRPVFQALDAYNPIMRRRLQKKLAELKPDVVHAHNLQGFSVSAWVAARNAGVPVVQTLHDYYTACPRSTMWRPGRGNCETPCAECKLFAAPRRSLSSIPTIVTSVSRRVLDRINRSGVFGRNDTIIIRGNNPSDSVPASGHATDNARLRLGFIGRLDPVKGLEDLLAVMGNVPPDQVSLKIAGGGSPAYVDSLKAQVPPQTDIEFLGHVKPESFFGGIDLLVVPSVWEDPFPRVFHEALQHGVPSLVMPLGGLPEAIIPGVTGFVAPQPGRAGLRAAIFELLEKGWERELVRQACIDVSREYAPDHIVSEYETTLEKAARAA